MVCVGTLALKMFIVDVVASNREELDILSYEQEFLSDWYMQPLVGHENE